MYKCNIVYAGAMCFCVFVNTCVARVGVCVIMCEYVSVFKFDIYIYIYIYIFKFDIYIYIYILPIG